MRVTLVTAHYPPKLSGHADFSRHLASSLHRDGVDMCVVSLGEGEPLEDDGFRVVAAPFPSDRWSMKAALDAIDATTPDAVCLQFEAHAFRLEHGPHLLPLLIRRRGHRVVMTYHELWKPGRLGHLSKLVLLNSAHRVVTFSSWHADGVDRFRRLGPRADIVSCGSNIVRPVAGDRTLLRARYGVEADVVLFTFFGFIMVEHRIAELLEALAVVRATGIDARLQLIGRFDPVVDGYHQRLADAVADLELTEAVTWHGRVVSDGDVARLIAISDVGVLPYDSGVGENNGAFAALAHYGIPTVTTRGERSGDMEELDIARFADPTAESLAEEMGSLARDPATRELLAKRVSEWAERRSWSRAANAYHRLLRVTSGGLEPAGIDVR